MDSKKFLKILLVIMFFILQVNTSIFSQEECATWKRLDMLKTDCPPRPTYVTVKDSIMTNNFKIHFTLSGIDATTRAWAESVAVYAETTYARLGRLGWALPPQDDGRGGDNRYDIYIRDTNSIGGYALAMRECPKQHHLYPDSYTSWNEISSVPIPVPGGIYNYLKSMVSHELVHASQFTYSGKELRWFGENTAVYMEKVIFPETNTLVEYRFLRYHVNPLKNPEYGINDEYMMYTGAIWPTFLHEYYDILAPRRCYEIMGYVSGENTLNGIDSALKVFYSSDIKHALKWYAVWRYFTGDIASVYKFFSQAEYYPTPTIHNIHSSYPIAGNSSGRNPWVAGGTGFVNFVNATQVLNISFDGIDRVSWAAMSLIVRRNEPPIVNEIVLHPNNYTGNINLCYSDSQYSVLIPVIIQLTFPYKWTHPYNYAADITSLLSCVKFTNEIRNMNAGGKLLVNEIDTVNSGDSKIFSLGSTNIVRTMQERFERDSIYKHNNWKKILTKHKLKDEFTVNNNFIQSAHFSGLNPTTIRNSLIDAPSQNFGTIQFHDPWYLDQNNQQRDSFYTFSSPHLPTGAYGKTTGGVFLNQGWPTLAPPYYSVRVPRTQIT